MTLNGAQPPLVQVERQWMHHLPEPDLMSDIQDANQRHTAKMARRKSIQDAEVASKTITSKGLLMVNTGKGKGKSTAAFGLGLRALGHGWRVGIVQFGKGAWETGEKNALKRFDDLVEMHTLGEGFDLGNPGPSARCRGSGTSMGQGACPDGGPDNPTAGAGRTQHRTAL